MSTIKEVAKLAGVSISTVSRTLSGNAFVEEETKNKVLKAIKELDYRPNQMARSLRVGKTNTFALMIPDINSLYYPMLMKSVERYVKEKNYALMLCNDDESIELEKKNLDMLVQKQVDGIFCMSVSDDVRHFAKVMEESKIPVVLINRNLNEKVCCVTYDNIDGAYQMTKHLLEHGHRKIAGVFGSFENQRFRHRYEGCKRAMEEYGVADYKKYFLYDVGTTDEAYVRTKDMLSREDRPTAFFASLDLVGIGIYSAVERSGFRIPEDISIVSYDNIYISEYLNPPLTTYNASTDVLAKESVACMFEMLEGDYTCTKEPLVIKGNIVERQSVADI